MLSMLPHRIRNRPIAPTPSIYTTGQNDVATKAKVGKTDLFSQVWTLSKERRNSEIGFGREISGKRQRGRRRRDFFLGGGGGLASAVGCGEVGALRRAGDRDGCRRLVADVSPCHGTQRRRR